MQRNYIFNSFLLVLCTALVIRSTSTAQSSRGNITLLEGPKTGNTVKLVQSPVSGTVVALVATSSLNIYTRLLRSLDDGRTWETIYVYLPWFTRGSSSMDLVVDPYGDFWMLAADGNLLHSTDDGVSWQIVRTHILSGGECRRIIATRNHLYLDCDRGLFKSDREGRTWKLLNTLHAGWHNSIVFGDTIVISEERPPGFLQVSRDAGESFDTVLSDGFLDNLRFTEPDIIGAEGILYAQTDLYPLDGKYTARTLWKSTDLGYTWQREFESPFGLPLEWTVATGQGVYGYRHDSLFIFAEGELSTYPLPIHDLYQGAKFRAAPLESDKGLLLPALAGIYRLNRRTGEWSQTGGAEAPRSLVAVDPSFRWELSGTLLVRTDRVTGERKNFRPGSDRFSSVLATQLADGNMAYLQDHTLQILNRGNEVWSDPLSIPDGISRKGMPTGLWTRGDTLLLAYRETSGQVPLNYVLHSTDRGSTWTPPSDRLSRIDSALWVGAAPYASNADAFRLSRSWGDSTSILSLHWTTTGGIEWRKTGEIAVPNEIFVDEPGQIYDRLMKHRKPVRGENHIAMQVSPDRWIIMSDRGIDTLHYEDEDQTIYGLIVHEERFVGLVDSTSLILESVHTGDLRIPRLRLAWRDTGSDYWQYWDPEPVAGMSVFRENPNLPVSPFFTADGMLYAISRFDETWQIDAMPERNAFTLSIQGGYGSGRYQAGTAVQIWGRELQTTEAFGRWNATTADVSPDVIVNPREWHATLTMPDKDLDVRAVFDTLTEYVQITRGLSRYPGDSIDIAYADVGVNLRGVIFVTQDGAWNHGRFFREPDGEQFTRDALKRGYMIVVLASHESAVGDLNGDEQIRWDTAEGGVDQEVWNDAISLIKGIVGDANDGIYPPLYAVATDASYQHHDAGITATRVASEHRLSAIAYMGTTARTDVFRTMWSPSIFVAAGSKWIPPERESGPYSLHLLARWLGRVSEYHAPEPVPIYPERFHRIEGISIETSKKITDELISMVPYFLHDRDGNYSLDRAAYDTYTSPKSQYLPTLSALSQDLKDYVWHQLIAIAAQAGILTDYNETVLDFFERHTEPALPSSVEEESELNDTDLNLTLAPSKPDGYALSSRADVPRVPDGEMAKQPDQ